MTKRRPYAVITASEAARILGVSRERVRQLAAKGALPICAQTETGTPLFERAAIERAAKLRRREDD